MFHPVSWLSCIYLVGAIATFFTGAPAHLDQSSLTATVETTQRLMTALIWPFYWPMRLSWMASHPLSVA